MISRRSLLTAAGSLTIAGGLTRTEYVSVDLQEPEVSVTLPEQIESLDPRQDDAPAPMEQKLGFGNGFESATFLNLGETLRVKFEDDHQMDGFGLAHEYRTEVDDWIGGWEAPNFGGDVDIDFFGELRDHADTYPTRAFELIGYRGTTGIIGIVEEELGSGTIVVPERIAPSDLFGESNSEEEEV